MHSNEPLTSDLSPLSPLCTSTRRSRTRNTTVRRRCMPPACHLLLHLALICYSHPSLSHPYTSICSLTAPSSSPSWPPGGQSRGNLCRMAALGV